MLGYLTADCHFQHLFGKETYKSSNYVVPVNALRDDYLAVMRSSHKAVSELTPQKLMAALKINVITALFLDKVFETNNSCLAVIRDSNRNHYSCIYLKESQLLPALLTLTVIINQSVPCHITFGKDAKLETKTMLVTLAFNASEKLLSCLCTLQTAAARATHTSHYIQLREVATGVGIILDV